MKPIVAYIKQYAEEIPSKPAVIANDTVMSYYDLWREVRGFASYLQSFGFEKGSRIVVKAFPSLDFPVACFACHLAGYTFVPIEKTIGVDGVGEVCRALSAVAVISDQFADDACVCIPITDVRRIAQERFDDSADFPMPCMEDLSDILFTTGTTGKSKGVCLTHRAEVAVADHNRILDQLTQDSVYLIAVPFNHANGIRKFYATMMSGAKAVLLDGFMNMKRFYETIDQYHVTVLVLPPSAIRVLLTVSKNQMKKYSDQIKVIHSGAAALPETDKEVLTELFPHSRLIFGYGASEAGSSCGYDYAEYPGLTNCIGKPNLHSKLFIVDENRQPIESSPNRAGLIAISGDTLMSGYYNEPELTESVLKDGVMYTNDIGYIDENGFVFMLGRTGDVINVGGLKIAPVEVENIVMRYPGVVECACFGIPDKLNGFVPKLNLICDPEVPVDLVAFRAYLQKNLEMFKVPKVITFVDELPKTSNGKLDRKRLQ